LDPSSAFRLDSKSWIDAQLRVWFGQGGFACVLKKGDPERGGILLKLLKAEGQAELYERTRDFDGNPCWQALGKDGDNEQTLSPLIEKRCKNDPDLWVLEIEDPGDSYELDAPLLDI